MKPEDFKYKPMELPSTDLDFTVPDFKLEELKAIRKMIASYIKVTLTEEQYIKFIQLINIQPES